MAFKMRGWSPFTKPNDNDPNRTAQDKMTADYNKAKTEYLMDNMEYRKPTQEEVDSGYYNPDAKVGITDFNDPVYDEKMKNFSFKVGGREWTPDSSPMQKNGDFKKTKKKILSSTNIPTKEEPEGIPSEYTGRDDGTTTDVYRKGGKKYVKELDLYGDPTGEYQQITRKGKKQLKKEGSYVSGRKYKKIKDDYLSGKYAEDQHKKKK